MPIYIAALGQKNVEGTAEYADGWLPYLFAPEKAHKVWGDALAAGKAKRQDGLGPLEIVAGGMVCDRRRREGDAGLRPPDVRALHRRHGRARQELLQRARLPVRLRGRGQQIQDLYLGGNKRDAEALVPLELLEMCNLVGPESYVKERIAAFREAGVTNLQIMPVPRRGTRPPWSPR